MAVWLRRLARWLAVVVLLARSATAQYDVTLVTQSQHQAASAASASSDEMLDSDDDRSRSTSDKLHLLPLLCDRWRGPLSRAASVVLWRMEVFEPLRGGGRPFGKDCDDGSTTSLTLVPSLFRRVALFLNSTEPVPSRKTVEDAGAACETFHVAMVRAEAHSAAYPVNSLRNLALSMVNTTHHLVSDMDFLPSRGLRENVARATSWLRQEKLALVIPAFQRRGGNCKTVQRCLTRISPIDENVPADFDSLKTCLDAKECIVFQSENSWDSHSTTNSAAWLHDDRVRPLPCFHTNRYEPYVVVRHSNPPTPAYDERFTGYGKNKIQHVAHLRRIGFEFAVFPRQFLVHVPHPRSKAKDAWTSSYTVHRAIDKLYDTFLAELDAYPGQAHVNICKDRRRRKQKKKTHQR